MKPRQLATSSQTVIATAGQRKLRASSGFLQRHHEHPEDIVAVIEVAKEDYIPKGVALRQSISPLMFTATIVASELEAVLADEDVVLVQPSAKLGTLAPE